MRIEYPCSKCGGTGEGPKGEPCDFCDGSGYAEVCQEEDERPPRVLEVLAKAIDDGLDIILNP